MTTAVEWATLSLGELADGLAATPTETDEMTRVKRLLVEVFRYHHDHIGGAQAAVNELRRVALYCDGIAGMMQGAPS